MKCFVFVVLIAHATMTIGCLKPEAAVLIQNYDCPIYVSSSAESRPPICDKRLPSLTNMAPSYPTLTNLVPGYDNQCPTLAYSPTCGNHLPPTLLHSAIPYHQSTCEADCKCVTKHQTACVPVSVNSVPQNSCTPGYYCPTYPETGYQYPEGYYGYGGQSFGSETDLSCPRISETLIPLLKTYLSQSSGTCPKHSCQCQCGKHAQCYV